MPTPPVVAMSAEKALAWINAAWAAQGEAVFSPRDGPSAHGVVACSGGALCITLTGTPERVPAITLSGPVGTRDASRRYFAAQALLVRLAAPGAVFRPVVTADRLAVGDMRPADAQLGPTCMHVQVLDGTMSTTFSRRRCTAG